MEEEKKDKLREFIRHRSNELGISEKEMANVCLATQPYFSRTLVICNFSFVELIRLFKLLQASESDIKEFFL